MKINLYRKNNAGQPYIWSIDNEGAMLIIEHGILGKTIHKERIPVTMRNATAEINSRVNQKRKEGYIAFGDVKDDLLSTPVEDMPEPALITYLTRYLPTARSNSNNDTLLAMLAKSYDINCFKYASAFLGQWKINGLRCIIRAYKNNDMFKPYGLTFQSREGIYWSLIPLEDYLLNVVLTKKFIERMIEEGIALDGEVYLPGKSINEINHFVKDSHCAEHKLLQYWCYDLAVEDMTQFSRIEFLDTVFGCYIPSSKWDINDHMNNNKQFILLPVYNIDSDASATAHRNKFLAAGFEGLIMRNPDKEYAFGSRSIKTMIKYKSATDGKFKILDIYKEPKRDVPILLCENDINNATFETRVNDSFANQKIILDNREKFIGKEVFIRFSERSGVARVPFHIRDVTII